jgi:hypothetical protein
MVIAAARFEVLERVHDCMCPDDKSIPDHSGGKNDRQSAENYRLLEHNNFIVSFATCAGRSEIVGREFEPRRA